MKFASVAVVAGEVAAAAPIESRASLLVVPNCSGKKGFLYFVLRGRIAPFATSEPVAEREASSRLNLCSTQILSAQAIPRWLPTYLARETEKK